MALGNLVSKLQNMYVEDRTTVLPNKTKNSKREVCVSERGKKLIDFKNFKNVSHIL